MVEATLKLHSLDPYPTYPKSIKSDVNILNLRFLLAAPSKGAGVHISFPAEVIYDLSTPKPLSSVRF